MSGTRWGIRFVCEDRRMALRAVAALPGAVAFTDVHIEQRPTRCGIVLEMASYHDALVATALMKGRKGLRRFFSPDLFDLMVRPSYMRDDRFWCDADAAFMSRVLNLRHDLEAERIEQGGMGVGVSVDAALDAALALGLDWLYEVGAYAPATVGGSVGGSVGAAEPRTR